MAEEIFRAGRSIFRGEADQLKWILNLVQDYAGCPNSGQFGPFIWSDSCG